RDGGHGRQRRAIVEAQARQTAHGRRAPERCCRVQTADTESLPRRGVREATLAAPLSRGRATPAPTGRLRRHLPHSVLALTVPAPPRQASDAVSYLSHRQRDAARDVL